VGVVAGTISAASSLSFSLLFGGVVFYGCWWFDCSFCYFSAVDVSTVVGGLLFAL
jgi:hypothetical protein